MYESYPDDSIFFREMMSCNLQFFRRYRRQNANNNTNSSKPATNLSAGDAGTKLRRAAKKGRVEEVRALLVNGAPVTKDSVRTQSVL